MNLELPAETMEVVQSLVSSGEFSSPQDAVAEGVRLLAKRRQLRADIQQGIAELDAGQSIDGKQVFAELRERAKSLMECRGL